MSKTVTVKYSCGHGEHDIEIKGLDPKEDASRIYWFEHNIVCDTCYKNKTKNKTGNNSVFKDDTLPPTVNCTYEKEKSYSYLKFVASGKLNENKDKLKSIGFRWDKQPEVDENTGKTYQKWVMIYTFKLFSFEEMQEFLPKFRELIESIGYKLYTDMFDLPVSEIKKDIEKFQNSNIYNGCYEFMKEKHGLIKFNSWNGKIYGSSGNKSYYIDNTKYDITDDEADAIIEFSSKL